MFLKCQTETRFCTMPKWAEQIPTKYIKYSSFRQCITWSSFWKFWYIRCMQVTFILWCSGCILWWFWLHVCRMTKDDKGKSVLEVLNMYHMSKNIFLKYKAIDGITQYVKAFKRIQNFATYFLRFCNMFVVPPPPFFFDGQWIILYATKKYNICDY